MRQIFVYKDDLIDLGKVSAIEYDENEVIFYMDNDWDIAIEVDDKDIRRVKTELLEMFKSK